MTGLFDGVAGLLNDTFGALVTWLPEEGGEHVVQSVFRSVPSEVDGAAGEAVLVMGPEWRVPQGVLPRPPRRRDRIRPGDGKTYVITSVHPSGSPAADRFLTCDLELEA